MWLPSTGLLLPVLGALPDSLIIVVSGLGGTVAEAQEQVQPAALLQRRMALLCRVARVFVLDPLRPFPPCTGTLPG